MNSGELRKTAFVRLIILGILVVVLFTALVMYTASPKTFLQLQAAPSAKPPLTNPEILQNWLPESSYRYTTARIDDYLSANNLAATAVSVSYINNNNGAYNFIFSFAPTGTTLPVSVTITNFNTIISTAVTINGKLQNPQISTPPNSSTSISGLNTLVDEGLTVTQASNLQMAFHTFTPSARTITIDTSNSSHIIDPSTGTNTYTFSAQIDDKMYDAKLICPDIHAIELALNDPHTHKQIFDSGIVDSAN